MYNDFCRDLLSGGEGYLEPATEDGQDESGGLNHEPDVSLVTGRVRAGGVAQVRGLLLFSFSLSLSHLIKMINKNLMSPLLLVVFGPEA